MNSLESIEIEKGNMERPLILVTNDDGIKSPGLAALVAALDPLGELLIAAPAEQQTSMGRSRTRLSDRDGQIIPQKVRFGEKYWDGFSVRATPALVVEYALQVLASRPISLAISGINYGENIGSCVTVSGTIGAALEAADRGIPAMTVSLEIENGEFFKHDESVDFRSAMHFANYFAGRMLGKPFPADVDVLKIEIPKNSTPDSPWVVTRQDRLSYYSLRIIRSSGELKPDQLFETSVAKGQFTRIGTDAHALAKGFVSITPLSLDCSSRTDLLDLQKLVESSR